MKNYLFRSKCMLRNKVKAMIFFTKVDVNENSVLAIVE